MVLKFEDKIKDLHLDLGKWKEQHDLHLGKHDVHKEKFESLYE